MNPSRAFDLPAFLRALFFILSAVVHTSLLGPPALVGCFLDPSRRWPSFFQGLWVHWLFRTNGIHLRLEGLEKGISVIVFPEGTRSPDGEVKEFKRGAFLLAQRSKFPVVPVSIIGTYEMLPRQGWCFWPGTMHIHMGNPSPPTTSPIRN